MAAPKLYQVYGTTRRLNLDAENEVMRTEIDELLES